MRASRRAADQRVVVDRVDRAQRLHQAPDIRADSEVPDAAGIDDDVRASLRPDRRRASSGRAGIVAVSASTFCRTPAIASSSAMLVSTSAISAPTSRISASRKPRVVTAGEPRRMPLGFIGGLVSNGMAFLLTVMRARSSACLGFLAAQALGEHVEQHQVRIGAAGDHAEAGVHQASAPARARWPPPASDTPRTPAAWLPGSRPPWPPPRAPADRPACRGRRSCRSPCRTSPCARIMPARGPRSVLCVVEVTMSAYWQGLGCTPAATRPGDVRHVHQEHRAHRIGDLAEAREIDNARIGAGAGDDHLGLVLLAPGAPLRRNRCARLPCARCTERPCKLAGEVELVAVREVAAVRQVQAHDGVAGLQHRGVRGLVGLRARVRLHVDVLGAEELLGALARQVLHESVNSQPP